MGESRSCPIKAWTDVEIEESVVDLSKLFHLSDTLTMWGDVEIVSTVLTGLVLRQNGPIRSESFRDLNSLVACFFRMLRRGEEEGEKEEKERKKKSGIQQQSRGIPFEARDVRKARGAQAVIQS